MEKENQERHYDFKPFLVCLLSSFIVSTYMHIFISSLYIQIPYFLESPDTFLLILLIIIYSLLISMFLTFYFNEKDFLYLYLSNLFNKMDSKYVKVMTLFFESLIIFFLNAKIMLPIFAGDLFLYVILLFIFIIIWDSYKLKFKENINYITVNNKNELDNFISNYSASNYSILENKDDHVILYKEAKTSTRIIVLFLILILVFVFLVIFRFDITFVIMVILNILYIYYFVNLEKEKERVEISINENNQSIEFNNQSNEFIFCSKCGTKLKKDDVFCKHCGNKLNFK